MTAPAVNPLAALSLADALAALVDLLPPGVELVLRRGVAPVDSVQPERVEERRSTGAERSKRWRDRHAASRATSRSVTDVRAEPSPPRNADSVTRNGFATVCDGFGVSRDVSRDAGGVGGAGLLGLPLNDLKASKQASPDAREAATPRDVTRNGSVTPVTPVTGVTPVTLATPATLGFHPVLLEFWEREGLGVPSASAEAKWRTLSGQPGSGVALRDGKIVLADDLATAALKAEAAKARHAKPRDPWAWVLPGFAEGYGRACEAARVRREAAAVSAATLPRHVLHEREAAARWASLTKEQQDAEDARRQADIDRMLKGVRRVPDGD